MEAEGVYIGTSRRNNNRAGRSAAKPTTRLRS